MQLSNGLTPVALHLGHLMAEMPLICLGSTIIVIIWATIASGQFAQLGLMVRPFNIQVPLRLTRYLVVHFYAVWHIDIAPFFCGRSIL